MAVARRVVLNVGIGSLDPGERIPPVTQKNACHSTDAEVALAPLSAPLSQGEDHFSQSVQPSFLRGLEEAGRPGQGLESLARSLHSMGLR